MSSTDYDVLVVGAGFAGSVMAERLASQAGLRVLVIDRRNHIAGNAYDEHDEHGVLIHRYGPHIFHTNSERVVAYLSQFTAWRPYEHRVLAVVDGEQVPMPINRTTLNRLYDLDLRTEEEARAFLDSRAEPRERIETSEDSVVSRFGTELYETFFRGYTTKQWGMDPRELHAQVCARIPVRYDEDDRYFADSFQQMPADGYTAMFEAILDHPRIEVRLGVEYADVREDLDVAHVVWTGPIDEHYDFRFGRLPYRSLRFETRTHATPDEELLQAVAVVNYPDGEVPHTRVTEYRHMTGQLRHPWTTLHVEYPCAEGDPYYPVPRAENRELYHRYERLSEEEGGVTFVGRLARYQYLNMDQVVGQALASFDKLITRGVLPGAGRAGVTATVGAVVVTHDREELLRECLEAVRGQTRPPNRILVVDNASGEATRRLLDDEFPGVQVLRLASNEGGAGGFHEGIRAGLEQGVDWLWLMDDDTIPTPEALERLLERLDDLRGLPEPAILASRVDWTDGRMHPMNPPGAAMADMDHVMRSVEHGLLPLRSVTFPSLLVRTDAIRRHGLPQKHFFIWSDDIEYTLRILREEHGYLVPTSVAVHKTARAHRPSEGGTRFYYAARNGLYVLRGNALRPKEKVGQSLVLVEQMRQFLVLNRFRPWAMLVLARGIRDGLLTPHTR